MRVCGYNGIHVSSSGPYVVHAPHESAQRAGNHEAIASCFHCPCFSSAAQGDHTAALQGKDDMRMDERLMQMMRLSDALMGADAATARRELHARTYSMTPLGARLGLVQWVGHTIPLFQVRMLLIAAVQMSLAGRCGAGSPVCVQCRKGYTCLKISGLQEYQRSTSRVVQVYRAWQQRHAERTSSRGRSRVANGEANSPVPAVTIPNATDVFYSRLNAALEVRQ